MKFKQWVFILILMALSAVIPLHSAVAVDPSKVLILPFHINADKDLTFLKNGIMDMLASRLTIEGKLVPLSKEQAMEAISDISDPVNDPMASSLGEKFGADYVVFGSLTVFGNSVSTDARFFDMNAKKSSVVFFDSAENQGDVISHINRFASQINQTVFGLAMTAPVPVTKKAAQDGSRRHPESLWDEEKGIEPETSPVDGVVRPSTKTGTIWKSRTFTDEIHAIAVGDADGDGANETVLAGEHDVLIYRFADGNFTKVAEIKGHRYENILSVSMADINENGKAEIFVTNRKPDIGTLQSFVLEWNGTSFDKIVKSSNWYYQVLNPPGGKSPLLIGQKQGIKQAFLGGIYRLHWKGASYESGEEIHLPSTVNIFGFITGDLSGSGQEMTVALTQNERLLVLNSEGKEEWQSNDVYGGKSLYIEFPDEASSSMGGIKETKRSYLSQRLIMTDVDEDGKNEIIVVKNEDMTNRYFARYRMFKSGIIECMAWDNLGLHSKWKTREISGYISDYRIADIDNDGEKELVFSVIVKTSNVLGEAKSYIVSQKLK